MSAPRRTGVRPGTDPETATPTVRVGGGPDGAGGAEPVAVVAAHLTGPAPPHAVRLDFRGPAGIDPPGPAALLMVRRHSGAARAGLYPGDRSRVLERLPRRTDVLGRLTAAGGRRSGPAR
ncbi:MULTISPECIES: hypothetical protein [Streptomyces]|uniref:hypothetical protein n=1 Tax=Streptomyces TaxID=1883 RepID=UPI0006893D9C|nr:MULTISPECIES: hypothetical protein [Streptomyces]